jgi:type VI secretion system protein ImpH
MAAEGRGTPGALNLRGGPPGSHDPRSPAGRLFREGYGFDFFQAVRLLHWLQPQRPGVGRAGPPGVEPVRFRARASLAFPPSAVHEVTGPDSPAPVVVLVQAFLGLTGPSGALPRHYTERLTRLEREGRGPERFALRDWLDLFNHRLTALFYRAWEKYRFYLHYERGGPDRAEPDAFTQALLSLVGLGTPGLRRRLRVSAARPGGGPGGRPTVAAVDDLALLRCAGLLAHRPRSAAGLQALLADHYGFGVRVLQFQGQWLRLEPPSMTRLGDEGGNNRLGVNALAGDQVWDVQSKFRLQLGPLDLATFNAFLPEPSDAPGGNAFFLLTHLARFYAGPALDFDVQLVLRADEVPECRLPSGDDTGPALGWNAWLRTGPFADDADDAVFPGAVLTRAEGPAFL